MGFCRRNFAKRFAALALGALVLTGSAVAQTKVTFLSTASLVSTVRSSNRWSTSTTPASRVSWSRAVFPQPDYDATINKLQHQPRRRRASQRRPGIPMSAPTAVWSTPGRVTPTSATWPPRTSSTFPTSSPPLERISPSAASCGRCRSTTRHPFLFFRQDSLQRSRTSPPTRKFWTYDELHARRRRRKLTKKDASGKVIRSGMGFTLYSWILEEELATQGVLFADPNNGAVPAAPPS